MLLQPVAARRAATGCAARIGRIISRALNPSKSTLIARPLELLHWLDSNSCLLQQAKAFRLWSHLQRVERVRHQKGHTVQLVSAQSVWLFRQCPHSSHAELLCSAPSRSRFEPWFSPSSCVYPSTATLCTSLKLLRAWTWGSRRLLQTPWILIYHI